MTFFPCRCGTRTYDDTRPEITLKLTQIALRPKGDEQGRFGSGQVGHFLTTALYRIGAVARTAFACLFTAQRRGGLSSVDVRLNPNGLE
jgi:hypothetical protein